MIEEEAGGTESAWTDPDGAPAWTDAMFDRSAIMDGDRVLRPGLGTMRHGYVDGYLDIGGPDGPRRVTIDVDRAVYERFLADGPGWEARMADALKRTVEAGGLCAEWLSAADEEAWKDL